MPTSFLPTRTEVQNQIKHEHRLGYDYWKFHEDNQKLLQPTVVVDTV
jgi:hypothetical protein